VARNCGVTCQTAEGPILLLATPLCDCAIAPSARHRTGHRRMRSRRTLRILFPGANDLGANALHGISIQEIQVIPQKMVVEYPRPFLIVSRDYDELGVDFLAHPINPA
jgi:hypothetical protein